MRFPALLLLLSLPVMCHAALQPIAEQTTEVDGPYDVTFALAGPAPSQQVLLDWQNGQGLVLTCDRTEARLKSVGASGRGRVIATARPLSGAVRIQRRYPEIIVRSGGEIAMRVASARALTGIAAPAAGSALTDFAVQPVEPVEFQDEFFDPKGGESAWEPVSGDWKIAEYRDPLVTLQGGPIGASWLQVEPQGQALTLTGYEFWDPCRLQVAVLAPTTGAAGLVWGYAGEGTYCAVLLRPLTATTARLETLQMREGKCLTRFSEPFPARAGNWVRLSLEPGGTHCRVLVSSVERARLLPAEPGRVGLVAVGPGLARFDDFSAESVAEASDAFTGAAPGEAWITRGGRWAPEGRGRLQAKTSGFGALLRRTDFTPDSVSAHVTGSGGLLLNWRNGCGYSLGIAGTRVVLARVTDGKAAVLATGSVPPGGGLWLRNASGRLSASGLSQPVYDFAYSGGAAGLCASGSASFGSFSASRKPEQLTTISTVTGVPTPMPGENEDTRRFVLGYVWQPVGGNWTCAGTVDEPRLVCRPLGQQSSLWYYQRCPGDASLVMQGLEMSAGGTIGLAIGCSQRDARSGYRVELTGRTVKLYRADQRVGERTLKSAPTQLRLWRDGNQIVAGAGAEGLTFAEREWLPGDLCGAFASGGEVRAESLTLGHRRGEMYRFRAQETDWQPVEGEWLVHSGLACIPWDYWYTGRGNPQALAVHVRPQPANLHLDLWVAEYTEGYENKHHQHFPYHDLSLVTSAAKPELDGGYRFLIGGEGGTVTRLLRCGKVVAETRDPAFIIRMESHCNRPRELHLVAHQEQGRLTLHINDRLALDWTDPTPLGGGLLGIGATGCSANFRDLWLAEL